MCVSEAPTGTWDLLFRWMKNRKKTIGVAPSLTLERWTIEGIVGIIEIRAHESGLLISFDFIAYVAATKKKNRSELCVSENEEMPVNGINNFLWWESV